MYIYTFIYKYDKYHWISCIYISSHLKKKVTRHQQQALIVWERVWDALMHSVYVLIWFSPCRLLFFSWLMYLTHNIYSSPNTQTITSITFSLNVFHFLHSDVDLVTTTAWWWTTKASQNPKKTPMFWNFDSSNFHLVKCLITLSTHLMTLLFHAAVLSCVVPHLFLSKLVKVSHRIR